jgi:chemotaxis protein MotA
VDLTTIIGVVIGIGLVMTAIFMGGSPLVFINYPSMMITFGGTIAATLISFNVHQVLNVAKVLRTAFKKDERKAEEIIAVCVKLAEKARISGILALEDDSKKIKDPLLKMGLELIIDGTDPALAKEILETQVASLDERHRTGRQVFESMALYAPAFGMIGTLIGLIEMLLNLKDPTKVGPGLAVAIITTFYGAFLAYLLLYPLARKLDIKSKEEILLKSLMIEGVLAIQAGNNPRLIARKLKAYLPPALQEGLEERIFNRSEKEDGSGLSEADRTFDSATVGENT